MVALASEPQEDTRKHGFRMISGMIQRFYRFLGPAQYYADLCRYRYTGFTGQFHLQRVPDVPDQVSRQKVSWLLGHW